MGHTWNYPYAFIGEHDTGTISLNDSARLKKNIVIPQDSGFFCIGLITNPRPGFNLLGIWSFGDGTTATDTFNSSFIIRHAYNDTGLFYAVFQIQDRVGNSLSDSVLIQVYAKPFIESLLSPIDGRKSIDPKEQGGVLFSWKVYQADPNDSIKAQFLLGTDSTKLFPVVTNIKDQFVYVNDLLLDYGTTYYWRIVIKSFSGFIDSSLVFQFNTIQLDGPSVKSINDTTVTVFDTVIFYATAIDSGGSITEYAWDFDGNGTFDFSDSKKTSKHVYSDSGHYTAIVRVTDSNLKAACDTSTITVVLKKIINKGPTIENIRHDTAVFIGDTVAFYATAVDSGDTIFSYSWDFDGNGIFDTSSQTSAYVNHVYPDTGKFQAVLRVVDRNNRSAFDTVAVQVVKKMVSDLPVIVDICHDTSVAVWDTVAFFATAIHPNGVISEYAWDFDANGIFDFYSDGIADCKHAYFEPGIYKAILKVTDTNSLTAMDTVYDTVSTAHLQSYFTPPDTVIEYGGTVRCFDSLKNHVIGDVVFEIDSAASGNFIQSVEPKASLLFFFTTGTATSWDSVNIRIFTRFSDTLFAGFKVDIRPRPPVIGSIDSTDTTVSVKWGKTLEGDFQEYRLYRSLAGSVDTNSELAAVINRAESLSFINPSPSFTLAPAYYRLYQKDKEGLMSNGSNIVYCHIKNSPPKTPVLLAPSKANDTMWSNSIVRWKKSTDPNLESVTYDVLLNRDSTGYAPYATGITDTFIQLNGFDTVTFRTDIKVIARDTRGGNSSIEQTGILCKQIKMQLRTPDMQLGLKIIPKGTFIDSAGFHATISYDYFMDTIEVSQLMYKKAMNGSNPSNSKNDGQPVEKVTWYQAILYCNAMSKLANLPDTVYSYNGFSSQDVPRDIQCNLGKKAFRLPTEDEWEMAAHGGKNFQYATDNGLLSCEKANFNSHSLCSLGRPTQCGIYPANPYGIRDMTGNVYEWCWDEFCNNCNRNEGRVDYVIYNAGTGRRVFRGGDFNEDNVSQLLASSRNEGSPGSATARLGFRCVISMKQWKP